MLFLHPINLRPTGKLCCICMKMNDIPKKELRALNVGLSLDILTKIATDIRYGKNIVDLQLLTLELLLGYHTYGIDRYKDDGISDNRTYIYDIVFILIIAIISNKTNITTALPFEFLIYSTRYYKDIKAHIGIFKSIYVSVLWCISIVILPSVLEDKNMNILNQPLDYVPYIFLMVSMSNNMDEKDIEDDKKNKIETIPVKYGLEISKNFSQICIIMFMFLLSINICDKFL